ncbi:hypothetical protein [Streptomyces longisporoflavus]|uniref:Uncharacterized protein n=1 Tax=Streptomyces longisporoflavus TaxID=28044 RepID=A0ABW7QIF7_9ACTN
MTTTADLRHHYGCTRAEHDRAIPDAFHWICSSRGSVKSTAPNTLYSTS